MIGCAGLLALPILFVHDAWMRLWHGPICRRCEGDGAAHGSDRPFESSSPGTYPGPCPVCKGIGRAR